VTRRVLVVDDDPTVLASVVDALTEDGITVTVADGEFQGEVVGLAKRNGRH